MTARQLIVSMTDVQAKLRGSQHPNHDIVQAGRRAEREGGEVKERERE